jgi:hypothetical protein
MRIDEDLHSVFFAFPQYSYHVVTILVVIFSTTISITRSGSVRPCMLDGFPGDQKSNDIEAVALYASKMLGGVLYGKGPPYETYMVSIKKSFADMGGNIRTCRLFCVSSDIEAPQYEDSKAEVS